MPGKLNVNVILLQVIPNLCPKISNNDMADGSKF
jgi:hypothetical protein